MAMIKSALKLLLTPVSKKPIRKEMGDTRQLSAYTSIYPDKEMSRVDRESGVIYGVSVISEGEALGHNAFVDTVTLRQVVDVANRYKGGVRVNVDHGTGLLASSGYLREFRLEERGGVNRVVADLYLLKAEEGREKLMELAETMPHAFGLSAVMSGEHEKLEDKTYLRCDEILSVDLVTQPAANPTGLFSRPETTKTITMEKEEIEELVSAKLSEIEEKHAAQLAELSKKLDAMKPAEKTEEELAAEAKEAEKAELERIQSLTRTVAQEFVKELGIGKSNPPAASPAGDPPPAETFEQKAVALMAEGKSKGEAISLAAKQNPDLHRDFIARSKDGKTKPITL